MINIKLKSVFYYGPLSFLMMIGSAYGETNNTSSEMGSNNAGERGYAGLLFGGNTTSNSSNNSNEMSPVFGITLGAKMTPEFGLGIMGSYYGQKTTGSFLGLPTGTSTSTTMILAQANFFAGGLHLGGEAGPAINSWSGHISSSHASDSSTNMVFGPEAGYDFKINKTLSLGAEAHYLISTGDSSVNNLQAFAAIKGWL